MLSASPAGRVGVRPPQKEAAEVNETTTPSAVSTVCQHLKVLTEAVKRANIAKLILSTVPSLLQYQKAYREAQEHLDAIKNDIGNFSANCHGLIVVICLSPEESLNVIERFRVDVAKNGKREHTNEVAHSAALHKQANHTAHVSLPRAVTEKMIMLCPLCCPNSTRRSSIRSPTETIVTRHVWLGSHLSARQQGRYRDHSRFLPTANGPTLHWPNFTSADETTPPKPSRLCCLLNNINHWGINDGVRLSGIWTSAGQDIIINDNSFFPDCARVTGSTMHRVVDPSEGGKYAVAVLVTL
uniref:Wsv267-like protein n=1 Tax=Melicertus latisulcatus pemonivirus TaxID=2984278 RepID=A0A9C7BZD1_9VIRU|nr:MAG: wsv267-like protein [Melicertus latisulcatus pemonivirus]